MHAGHSKNTLNGMHSTEMPDEALKRSFAAVGVDRLDALFWRTLAAPAALQQE